MIPPLPVLLDEFETLTLDDAVFLVQRNTDDLEVCVHFQKKQGATPWSVWFRLSEQASRQRCSKEHLPYVIDAFGITQEIFARDLAGRLLSQAAFADEFVRSVSELLGQEALRESIRSTQAFMEGLKDMVRRTIGPSGPTAEGSVNGTGGAGSTGGDGAPRKGTLGLGDPGAKAHLRIIRKGEAD